MEGEKKYGPEVVARLVQKYEDHLAEDFGPHRTDGAGRVLGLQEKIDIWVDNDTTFGKVFEKIGASEEYQRISDKYLRTSLRSIMDDDDQRDWILESLPNSVLTILMKYLDDE